MTSRSIALRTDSDAIAQVYSYPSRLPRFPLRSRRRSCAAAAFFVSGFLDSTFNTHYPELLLVIHHPNIRSVIDASVPLSYD